MKYVSLLLPVVVACAAPAPSRTIEPLAPGQTAAAPDDSAFVRERKPASEISRSEFPVHINDKWFPFRAEYLGISEAEARSRDGVISDLLAPTGFWDDQTAIEAVSIWSALCNECHGGRRRIKDAVAMAAPPAAWGQGDGLFFGARRPYREIFATIAGGGPIRNGVPSEMPAWQGKLAREQIWSLIYFLEFQSGGIEGRFPPSLYPRGPDDVQ